MARPASPAIHKRFLLRLLLEAVRGRRLRPRLTSRSRRQVRLFRPPRASDRMHCLSPPRPWPDAARSCELRRDTFDRCAYEIRHNLGEPLGSRLPPPGPATVSTSRFVIYRRPSQAGGSTATIGGPTSGSRAIPNPIDTIPDERGLARCDGFARGDVRRGVFPPEVLASVEQREIMERMTAPPAERAARRSERAKPCRRRCAGLMEGGYQAMCKRSGATR